MKGYGRARELETNHLFDIYEEKSKSLEEDCRKEIARKNKMKEKLTSLEEEMADKLRSLEEHIWKQTSHTLKRNKQIKKLT